MGRGARVIERIADVLMGIAFALYILAPIIYLIDVVHLKVPVSKAFRELLWFALLFLTVLFASSDLWVIEGFVSLVLGLRRLADVLPGLINGSELPKDAPECMVEYFGVMLPGSSVGCIGTCFRPSTYTYSPYPSLFSYHS